MAIAKGIHPLFQWLADGLITHHWLAESSTRTSKYDGHFADPGREGKPNKNKYPCWARVHLHTELHPGCTHNTCEMTMRWSKMTMRCSKMTMRWSKMIRKWSTHRWDDPRWTHFMPWLGNDQHTALWWPCDCAVAGGWWLEMANASWIRSSAYDMRDHGVCFRMPMIPTKVSIRMWVVRDLRTKNQENCSA